MAGERNGEVTLGVLVDWLRDLRARAVAVAERDSAALERLEGRLAAVADNLDDLRGAIRRLQIEVKATHRRAGARGAPRVPASFAHDFLSATDPSQILGSVHALLDHAGVPEIANEATRQAFEHVLPPLAAEIGERYLVAFCGWLSTR